MCEACRRGAPHRAPGVEHLSRRDALRRGAAVVAAMGVLPRWRVAERLLVPMDDAQRQHLKAYGLVYGAIDDGLPAEWLLNYRGGAFLVLDTPSVRRRAALDGVMFEEMDASAVAAMRTEVA